MTAPVPTRSHTFRIAAGDEPSSHFFEIDDVPKPDSATTQWLSFGLRLDGFTRHTPGSHFAVILQARLVRDAAGMPTALSGRGIALGDTSEAFASPENVHASGHPGYGGASGLVLESFWPGGNFLYREATVLDRPLDDGRAYTVHVHARSDRWFSAWMLDESGGLVHNSHVGCAQDDEAHPVLPASGILIVLARGANETGDWSVEFTDIGAGWF